MKFLKRILSLVIAVILVVSLASCDAKRNTKKPTGSLDLSKTYASLKTGETVSYSEVYNLLRKSGYNNLLNQINRELFKNETNEIKKDYSKYERDYFDYMLNQIYSMTDVDKFKDLEQEDIDQAIAKFVDNQLSGNGKDYSKFKSELVPTIDEENDELVFANWSADLKSLVVEQYAYTLGTIEYAKQYLNTIKNSKTITNVDGDEVDNDYYIDEDKIESRYESSQDYTTFANKLGIKYNNEDEYKNHAIVIKFASKAQATKYINLANTQLGYSLEKANITNDEVLNYYICLYNLYYKDKATLTNSNLYSNEGTTFAYDKETDDMSDVVGSTAKTFIYDELVDFGSTEGKSYLKTPFNLSGDNNLYMALRVNVYEGADWTELTDSQKTLLTTELTEDLIEDWATESYANTLVSNRLKSSDLALKIYDPVYENQFYNTYSDYYSFTKKFNNDYVFQLSYSYENDPVSPSNTEVNGGWKVYDPTDKSSTDAFTTLNSIYGIENASKLLSDKYLLNCSVLTNDIDSSTLDGYKELVKGAVKTFKKNNTSYSKKMGLSNYLVSQYGFETQDEVYNYQYKASTLVSAFQKYYGSFTNGETNTFVDNGLFANLQKFTTNAYNYYYSLDVSHMLICIDTNNDGTYEDPADYLENLSEANRALFEKDLLTLADAIALEAEVMTSDRTKSLQYIAKAFNNTAYSYTLVNEKYKGKTWADFKTNFEFVLTAEELGTINNESGTKYVEEFTNEVKSLYDTLTTEEYEDVVANIEDDGYWKYSKGVNTNGSKDQLTETVFGWHMLFVTNLTEQSDCSFTKKEDTIQTAATDTAEAIYTWQDQSILVYGHDADTSDDDEYVIASGYSETKYASIEQLFIYFTEYLSDGSVTSMKSKVVSAVSSYFGDTIARYTSSSFQTYRLYKQLGTITFYENDGTTSTYGTNRYNEFIAASERSIDSYATLTAEDKDVFADWFTLDWTVKNLHN